MEAYCVSFRKNTGNKNSSFKKAKLNRLMFLPNCAVCGKKNHLSLKTKNSTILIIYEMISLK